jgi:hypothetical protein
MKALHRTLAAALLAVATFGTAAEAQVVTTRTTTVHRQVSYGPGYRHHRRKVCTTRWHHNRRVRTCRWR